LREVGERLSTSVDVEPTDRELLARVGTDPFAFEIFYRRHVDRVVRFAARRVRNPADVADVAAATFVAVLTSARSYDPDRGAPTAWLLGIAARVIADGDRRHARESALGARLAGRRLIDTNDIERLEEQIHADQHSVAVMEAVSGLRPRSREVLLLIGEEGLTSGEAARVLGISAANFRMRLTAARRALAKALRPAGLEPPAARTSRHSASTPRVTPTETNLKEARL
jgi:RNA polymerase sigma factor (sigma-70 family)